MVGKRVKKVIVEIVGGVDYDFVEYANREIAKRTEYGRRTEVPDRQGYRVMWSNAASHWVRSYYATRPGTSLSLDANEVYLVGTKDQIDSSLEYFDPLPLYAMSFEFRAKGLNRIPR